MNESENLWEKIERLEHEIETAQRDRAFIASNDYIHSLHVLLRQAADALELWHNAFNTGGWKGGWMEINESLIAELRHAAE